jgi:PAS domain S-box-containing protein
LYVDVSPTFTDLLGYTVEEVINRFHFYDLFPEKARDRVRDQAFSMFSRKEPFIGFENQVITKDGRPLWVSTNGLPILDEQGELTGYRGADTDVTSFREIRELNRMLSETAIQSKDAILITDNQLGIPGGPRIIYVNPAMERMCGYSSEELIGKSPGILQGDKTDREVLDALKTELTKGNTFQAETVNYRKDGTEYMVEWAITPVLDEEGQIRHFASLQRDVTNLRKREKEELTQNRLESVGNMASGLVHDMNNILAPILMGSELMMHTLTEESEKRVAESIFRSSQRARDILKKLLLFTRGGGERRKLINPADVLAEVYDLTQETFPKEISVELRLPESPWPIRAGEHEIHQVFLNLALNARDCLEGRSDGVIQLELENYKGENGPRVLMQVTDNGPGISAAKQEHIFEPFFTTKEHGKGTGLGLSSAQGVVKSLDGTIHVESEMGKGSTFKILLPALPGEAIRPQEKISPLKRGNGERVLIVDDELPMVELLVRICKDNGYSPQAFSSSAEAIKALRNLESDQAPDIVLTDVMMPRFDGVDVALAVQEYCPGVPVVAVSGFVGHEKQEKLKELGVTTLLHKPIRMESLLTILHRQLHNEHPTTTG